MEMIEAGFLMLAVALAIVVGDYCKYAKTDPITKFLNTKPVNTLTYVVYICDGVLVGLGMLAILIGIVDVLEV